MALEAYINGQKTTPSKKRGDTLRFELELVSPTDDSTNEFSYALLVDDALKKVGVRGTCNPILLAIEFLQKWGLSGLFVHSLGSF